jgi:hypothetical protein
MPGEPRRMEIHHKATKNMKNSLRPSCLGGEICFRSSRKRRTPLANDSLGAVIFDQIWR